jgi:hypothetical protein
VAKSYQELRPSQFITTFGPGSIVETPSGPVVLKAMDTLFTAIDKQPAEFEIIDERLSKGKLGDARITRIPTNAELGLPTDKSIYPTYNFPEWGLCAQHRGHQVLYQASEGCPECMTPTVWQRREKAGREAIRFVAACEAGHLDEVPWARLAHPDRKPCGTRHYLWHGGGRALRLVRIECPKCKIPVNFGQAYGREWKCWARQPELGGAPDSSAFQCQNPARIVQRGSANLRMSELETALTILDMPARLHDILAGRSLLGRLETLYGEDLLDHKRVISAAKKAKLSDDSIAYLEQLPWRAIELAIGQLLNPYQEGPSSLQDAELEHLRNAAAYGAPANPQVQQLGSPPLFEVKQADVRTVPGPADNLTFRVVPISRLRMVMVQTGYRRLAPETGKVVSTAFERNGGFWYPGVELYGEGIFIDLADIPLALTGSRATAWKAQYDAAPSADLVLHPTHVWWHSLSHRLLWALSVDSGYSSAAIRERVYVRVEDGEVTASGLLLYTVQPGGDGTLGGMISLVNRFGRVLERGLQDVATCSNDPLCEEAPTGGAEGAACYACLFTSETSCEHRNHGLDRLLLTDNLP